MIGMALPLVSGAYMSGVPASLIAEGNNSLRDVMEATEACMAIVPALVGVVDNSGRDEVTAACRALAAGLWVEEPGDIRKEVLGLVVVVADRVVQDLWC